MDDEFSMLVGVRYHARVESGTAEITPEGVMVTPEEAGGG